MNQHSLSVSTVVLLHAVTALVPLLARARPVARVLTSPTGASQRGSARIGLTDASSLFSSLWARLLTPVIVSCFATALVAFPVRNAVDDLHATQWVTAAALVVNGSLLLLASSRTQGETKLHEIGLGTAVLIGLAQALGIVPGISRFGVTLLAALLCGLVGTGAVVYSFAIAVPVILGEAVAELPAVTDPGVTSPPDVALWKLLTVLMLTGLLAFVSVRVLLGRLGQKTLVGFALWSWGVGITMLAALDLSGSA